MSSSPYPNVRASGRGWAAYLPRRGGNIYLGTFDSPEEGYRRVLELQALGHEEVAAAYRARAETLEAS